MFILNNKQIGFFLSYYSPKYVRAATLKTGLLSITNLIIHEACNESKKLFRYYQSLTKALLISRKYKPEMWLINFRGHEIYWFVRWIVGKRSQIIFDEFVSPYDSLLSERKKIKSNSIIAKLLYRIEKSILNNSNYLITDTRSQAKYYSDLFAIPENKFHVLTLTADENIFNPKVPPITQVHPDKFIVFTYATFLPLHGMDIVLKAAHLLKEYPIEFVIAGGYGNELKKFTSLQKDLGLKNVFHIPWIEYNILPSYITGAHLCLGGPFGNTPQANRVITGKTFQFLACGSPTIIGLNEETKKFRDRTNCLLVSQGDPIDLANSISWAYYHQVQLKLIAKEGRLFYEQYFSNDILKSEINSFLNSIE